MEMRIKGVAALSRRRADLHGSSFRATFYRRKSAASRDASFRETRKRRGYVGRRCRASQRNFTAVFYRRRNLT